MSLDPQHLIATFGMLGIFAIMFLSELPPAIEVRKARRARRTTDE
jgi:hypothetical protein